MALKVEDRMTALALFVIGGLTLLLGGFSIRHNIQAIFYGDLGASSLNLNSSEQAQLDNLHNKDTDNDGLSDYDELYSYDTSPYLVDSDSDGTNDQAEVAAGTDPNCSGASCLQTRVGNNTNGQGTTENSTVAENGGTTTSTNAPLGANPTADEVRALLLNAGVSQQVLDQTDDATLLELYQQTIGQTSTTAVATNSSVDANYADLLQNTSTVSEDLENLTPDQIRALLTSAGIDPAILSQVNDADLMVIYKQALGEAKAETEAAE